MHFYGFGNRASASVDAKAAEADRVGRWNALLEPFQAQNFGVRSLTVVSGDAHRPSSFAARIFGMDVNGARFSPASPSLISERDAAGRPALEYLRSHAQELCGAAAGDDLLAAPAELLAVMMASAGNRAPFRAVAVIMPCAAGRRVEDVNRTLRRDLFDDGLVCIGSIEIEGSDFNLYLASDAVRSASRLDRNGRGQIIMSSLGNNGRFANQLFQYGFMRLYALRHGIRMAVPDWQGRKLFGLEDADSNGIELPELAFQGFSNKELELWSAPKPPADVDFWGYFQEIPPCWRPASPVAENAV